MDHLFIQLFNLILQLTHIFGTKVAAFTVKSRRIYCEKSPFGVRNNCIREADKVKHVGKCGNV